MPEAMIFLDEEGMVGEFLYLGDSAVAGPKTVGERTRSESCKSRPTRGIVVEFTLLCWNDD